MSKNYSFCSLWKDHPGVAVGGSERQPSRKVCVDMDFDTKDGYTDVGLSMPACTKTVLERHDAACAKLGFDKRIKVTKYSVLSNFSQRVLYKLPATSEPGVVCDCAASLPMSIMYLARMARPDLLWSTCDVACALTNIGGANRRCPTKLHCDNKGNLHDCREGKSCPY